MKLFYAFLALLFASVAVAQQPEPSIPQHNSAHDRQFWSDIKKNKYAPPTDAPLFPLAQELSANLASPDPHLRDDLAYTILDVWIVYQQQFSNQQLLSLLEDWQADLRVTVGESGTDDVFRRSFSALWLAALAERDLKTPFLGEQHYRTLLAHALDYLREERDLRAFDPKKGWIHATAHTADLLAFLCANPLLQV